MEVAPHAGARIETDPYIMKIAEKAVAPHAGARIETHELQQLSVRQESPPTRGRGLKPSWSLDSGRPARVAPHAGARIETPNALLTSFVYLVAPHAGARIETAGCKTASRWKRVAPHAGARIETPRRQ